MNTNSSEKILLHTCCAVCFSYPSNYLKRLGFEVVSYFYNPNIYPEKEFIRRRDELISFCKKYGYELILEDYQNEDFCTIALGLEQEPERGLRCSECFKLRLDKTYNKAQELGIKKYTTTLSVSPHKNSTQIFDVAKTSVDVEFMPFNFKKNNGAKLTNEIARENNLYRQTYCGCKYSIRA